MNTRPHIWNTVAYGPSQNKQKSQPTRNTERLSSVGCCWGDTPPVVPGLGEDSEWILQALPFALVLLSTRTGVGRGRPLWAAGTCCCSSPGCCLGLWAFTSDSFSGGLEDNDLELPMGLGLMQKNNVDLK